MGSRRAIKHKERKEANSVELDRTRTNSNTTETRGNDRQTSMKYEKRSKSIEVGRTFATNFLGHEFQQKRRDEF